ncbi:ABC transporter permease [Clostridium oceanicum]|uniref:ABC-2 family transporter protein n=1 Tax=Clostridium oceanicum TaxID=1543 RepID=A0ABP3UQT6_9CLOT
MLIKYHIKQQSKLILGIIAAFLVLNVYTILSKDEITWSSTVIILTLLPTFFTAHSFSKELEEKTEFLIFTSKTPKYKLLIQKYISGWIISEILIFITYIMAFGVGLENSMIDLLAVVIYSTFLSLVGLFCSNIFKKTLIGYGVPLLLVVSGMLGLLKKYPNISLVINLQLESIVVWSNLIIITLFCILFIIINLWLVSKGENFRKKLTVIGIIVVFVTASASNYVYASNLKKQEFWKNDTIKTIKYGNSTLVYKQFKDEYANKLSRICDVTVNKINDLFEKNKYSTNKFYVWYNSENIRRKDLDGYDVSFRSLIEFNSGYSSEINWPEKVNDEILNHMINFKDKSIKKYWIQYIFTAYIQPELKDKIGENIWIHPYDYNNKWLIDEMKEINKKKKFNYWDNTIAAANILYEFDKYNHEKTFHMLKELSYSKVSLDNKNIEKVCKKYFPKEKVDKVFTLYYKAKKAHEGYSTNKRVRADEKQDN